MVKIAGDFPKNRYHIFHMRSAVGPFVPEQFRGLPEQFRDVLRPVFGKGMRSR